MSQPRVSIVLPTLNSRRFLDQRLATIKEQTLGSWELIACDSYSTDGTWEVLKQSAESDRRIRLLQTPADGIYPNWNRGIYQATGEFVYIATSDDTMLPDCLAKLVTALDAQPDCSVADCCLNAIDEDGNIIRDWWKLTGAARFFGPGYLQPHIRRAPYDGVVHCGMHTVYHSITQVLVRRETFSQAGDFPTKYGPGGDFHWGMRIGLLCDVVHVPEFLATWRIHSAQSSFAYHEHSSERTLMMRMVEDVLARYAESGSRPNLPRNALRLPYAYDAHRLGYAEAHSIVGRLRSVLRLLKDPAIAFAVLRIMASGQRRSFDKVNYVRRLIAQLRLSDHFVLLETATP